MKAAPSNADASAFMMPWPDNGSIEASASPTAIQRLPAHCATYSLAAAKQCARSSAALPCTPEISDVSENWAFHSAVRSLRFLGNKSISVKYAMTVRHPGILAEYHQPASQA